MPKKYAVLPRGSGLQQCRLPILQHLEKQNGKLYAAKQKMRQKIDRVVPWHFRYEKLLHELLPAAESCGECRKPDQQDGKCYKGQ